MHELLVQEVESEIWTVTINRPEKRNAMKLAMWQALGEIMQRLSTDDSVRVIIITGAGGCFSAGADISEFSSVRADAGSATEYERAGEFCTAALMKVAKPTIAAVEGFCVGGGCGIAMCCDFRIARGDAQFGIPAARLGIVYGAVDTRNLINLVGLASAKRILYTGERIDAAEAFRLGLLQEVVAGGNAMDGALALARRLAANAPLSVAASKRILDCIAGADTSGLEALESDLSRQALDSEDYAEGVKAFGEKRAPVFVGR